MPGGPYGWAVLWILATIGGLRLVYWLMKALKFSLKGVYLSHVKCISYSVRDALEPKIPKPEWDTYYSVKVCGPDKKQYPTFYTKILPKDGDILSLNIKHNDPAYPYADYLVIGVDEAKMSVLKEHGHIPVVHVKVHVDLVENLLGKESDG